MNIAAHPHGIRPSGNHSGVQGSGLFGSLSDDLLAHLLTFLDDWHDLVRLGGTCRRLYGFSLVEDTWKDAYVAAGCDNAWRGSWRRSFLSLPREYSDVRLCGGVYSDLLYRPFFNAQIDLAAYLPGRRCDAIPRYADLTLDEFKKSHTHRPFILTQPVKSWPAMERCGKDHAVHTYFERTLSPRRRLHDPSGVCRGRLYMSRRGST